MRYKIKDIPEEGRICRQPLDRALLGEAFEGMDVDLDRTRAEIDLQITRSHDDLIVRGTMTGALGLTCAACLGPTAVELKVPIKMVYVLAEEDEEPGEREEDVLAEEDVGRHDGVTLDLAPMLREQLILAVPMSVRCREDCRGLCPECGQDRNQRDCGHTGRPAEASPFAALKDLKLS